MVGHHSVLWSIRHVDSNIENYIFGTVHLLNNEIESMFYRSIFPIIKTVDVCFLEADIYNEYGNILTPNSPCNWFEQLDEKKRIKFERKFQKYFGVKLYKLAVMFPPIIIIQWMAMNRANSSSSLDMLIYHTARSLNKEISNFEKCEDQIKLLNYFAMEAQVKAFAKELKNISSFTKKVKKLIDTYQRQDIDKILKYSINNFPNKEIRDIFVRNRNIDFANKIIDAIYKNKKHLFTFGAGHLANIYGTLNILQKKGFIIKPIKLNE